MIRLPKAGCGSKTSMSIRPLGYVYLYHVYLCLNYGTCPITVRIIKSVRRNRFHETGPKIIFDTNYGNIFYETV